MVSIDGSKSLQAAFDELFDHTCGPCKPEGNEKAAKQYCGDCSEYLRDPCVRYHRKLPLTKNHKIMQGALQIQNKKDKQGDKIVLLGKQIQSRREVNVSLADDNIKPWITDCAVMPNGNIVICDYQNDRLKLFNNSWVFQESLKILDIARVSVIDPSTVIVSVQQKLQYIHIFPQLQVGRAIQLETECGGVCVSGNEIYVTCKTSKGREIRVLDLDGNQKRLLAIDMDIHPYDVIIASSGEKVFFTDSATENVTCTCITVDGRIIYEYRDENLKDATGIYCDSGDNLFVCDYESNTAHVITADGKKYGTLLTSSDGLNCPTSIAYRSYENELIIGCEGLDKLLVYKLTN